MNWSSLLIVVIAVAASGCAGRQTFSDTAREGETVAVAAGLMHSFTRENITVTITPASGSPVTYPANDPAIRAVTNLYADPLSSIVISREIGNNETPFAQTYAGTVASFFTGDDKDWWQTLVILDLPTPMAAGLATVDVSTLDGTETASATLNIVAGTGAPNSLDAEVLGPLQQDQLTSLQRVEHYTVQFSGSPTTTPYAIQVDLTHDADRNNGGTGLAYVVNPIGYIKNAAWSDDGTSTRVILTPTNAGQIRALSDFKFYVAGRVTNLAISSVQAFDESGAPVSGVFAAVAP
jgi:uncharacterized protein YceK